MKKITKYYCYFISAIIAILGFRFIPNLIHQPSWLYGILTLIFLITSILILHFENIKEINLFGLAAKLNNQIKKYKRIEINNYRLYIAMLVEHKTLGIFISKNSFRFCAQNLEEEIEDIKKSPDLTKQDKQYILHPYYSYKIHSKTKELLKKHEKHLTPSLWGSESREEEYELASKLQVENLLENLRLRLDLQNNEVNNFEASIDAYVKELIK